MASRYFDGIGIKDVSLWPETKGLGYGCTVGSES